MSQMNRGGLLSKLAGKAMGGLGGGLGGLLGGGGMGGLAADSAVFWAAAVRAMILITITKKPKIT